MKNFYKDHIRVWLMLLLYLSPIIIGLLVLTLGIIALVKYGNSTIDEVPMWALFFLRR